MIQEKDRELVRNLIMLLEKYRRENQLDGVKVYFLNENALTVKGIRGGEIATCIRMGKEHFDCSKGA